MKTFKILLSAVLVAVLTFCVSTSYAQNCKDENGYPKKGGIALTRDDENGNHNTPTAAMSLPKFKGGSKALYRYIYKNQQYPQNLKNKGISGQAQVSMMVHADSTITDVELFKTSGYKEMDDEAIRLMKNSPKWVPAKQDCQCIDMRTVVTVPFDPTRK
ncbi:MAG: energy transducer TonB [Bacteroidales bacterium]|nr:energy transducer TonB [Bacteroidales bacterium]